MTKLKENFIPIKRALISVSDKSNILELARSLQSLQVEIISTGGTARHLQENGIEITPIEKITGNPECFGGRMKTISFQIESALLYKRFNDQHLTDAKKQNIQSIDLVVCNLYPFAAAVEKQAAEEELIENIDIGGPTMIRAAAKNYEGVAICVDPHQYNKLISELNKNKGAITFHTRRRLAVSAFQHTAQYDSAIANEFATRFGENTTDLNKKFITMTKGQTLRYGENPHQNGEVYSELGNKNKWGIAGAQTIAGKPLSYNNFLDADAALRCASDIHWASAKKYNNPATVVVVKHLNPCGVAVSASNLKSLINAWAGDPVSAFGSIICFSKAIDEESAKWLSDKFIEIVVTPSIDQKIIDIFAKKKNLRILITPIAPERPNSKNIKSIAGGFLVQDEDEGLDCEFNSVTKKTFPLEKHDLAHFGIMCGKHLKSNAIALVQEYDGILALVGAGMGQPNRIDSLEKLALPRAAQNKNFKADESILISDAFFPFSDNIDIAAKNNIRYIVEPGGSIRDDKVIAACDANNIAMIFTNRRHFRH